MLGEAPCPACGAPDHAGAPCERAAIRLVPLGEAAAPAGTQGLITGRACRCLPDAQRGWVECAACGLVQAPGKAWCGYCGSRWVTAATPAAAAPASAATPTSTTTPAAAEAAR